MNFVVDNLVEALAPSNNPLVNPVAWKALIDTAGLSSVTGARHLIQDLSTAPRVPSMIEPTAFEVGRTNALTQPGRATMLGSPVDLGTIGIPSYVIAGINDHICPWQSCYRSTQLLGGESRFVLSTAGRRPRRRVSAVAGWIRSSPRPAATSGEN